MKQTGIILGLVIFISTQALYGQSTIMRDGTYLLKVFAGEKTLETVIIKKGGEL